MPKKTQQSRKTRVNKRYIVSVDTETTGLDQRGNDHIIQLAAIKFDPDLLSDPDNAVIDKKVWVVIPAVRSWKIEPTAEAVHGISKEYVLENGIPWKDAAAEFLDFIQGCDILTYNGNHFDIRFLYNDLRLIGLDLPMDRTFFDSLSMEIVLNPRDLSAVYKRYTGQDMEGAHDALADALGCLHIFSRQVSEGPISLDDWRQMMECQLLSPDGTIRDTAGPGQAPIIVFNIGKYKDNEFVEVLRKDPDYVRWFSQNVCSPYTWKVLQEYYQKWKDSQVKEA